MPLATRYGFQGAICGANFTDREANVVCRQRGFAKGYALKAVSTEARTLPYVLSGLRCTGNETGLDRCPSAPFVNARDDCGVRTSAHVLCTKTAGRLYIGLALSLLLL